MLRYLSILLILASFTAGGTLRAATEPHAAQGPEADHIWTNEDLEGLNKVPGLISIVGEGTNEGVQEVDAPAPQRATEDPAWYAAQAASLNARLESEQADLRNFTKALDDARELKSTGGVDLFADEIALTPEATIEILQDRVRETQSELDALEDLARRNGIEPGVLRGQSRNVSSETAVAATEQSQSDSSTRGGDL